MPEEAPEILTATRLPLFPLADEVHFPRTELQLRVVEPDYCALVEELYLERGDDVFIGTVLLKPDWAQRRQDDVFPAGTAGRLLAFERHDEGCDIWLHGEYRFEVEREIEAGPCRLAVVRPVVEPTFTEWDPGVRVVRSELVNLVGHLAGEIGVTFPLPEEELAELHDDNLGFEEVVNFLASRLDLTPIAKLRLLSDALLERALHLRSILQGRIEVLETLRPFRHLEAHHELN